MRLDWIKASEKDPDDKVRVHKGFSEQYNAVRNDLWAVVQLRIDEFPDTSEILITGHSLGGALTTMCALDFRLRQSQGQFGGRGEEIQISAYPLAAPRTGNSKFRELFSANVATCDRLVLEKDWIPSMPPKKFGYQHVGRKIKLQTKEFVFKSNRARWTVGSVVEPKHIPVGICFI